MNTIMKITRYILSLIIISSCASKNEKNELANPIQTKADTTSYQSNKDLTGCYKMVIGKDSAFLNVNQVRDSITGFLKYDRFEKDDNVGKLYLKVIDDRAEGYYYFESEGIKSVRQIIFKLENNAFAEAYGELKMSGDTALYKYPHALNYEEKHPYIKINCEN